MFFLTSHQKVQAPILTGEPVDTWGFRNWRTVNIFPLDSKVDSRKGAGVIHSLCRSPSVSHSTVVGLDLEESERASYKLDICLGSLDPILHSGSPTMPLCPQTVLSLGFSGHVMFSLPRASCYSLI